MTSWTRDSATSAGELVTPEEQAFLAGGPGRAAEVALVSLVEVGAARISRDGLVSAVQSARGRASTPLQARVLNSSPRWLGDLVTTVAGGPETAALRERLLARGHLRPIGLRRALDAAPLLLMGVTVVLVLGFQDHLTFWHGAVVFAVLVSLVLLARRAGRPLTGSGRAVVRRLGEVATTADRVSLVAYYGLLGTVAGLPTWQRLGIAPEAAAKLRRRPRSGGGHGGSSCGGCGGSGSDGGGDSSGGCGGGGGE
ncbi:TIGR04222 domain-containing membrane protein [Saccharothrix australiensis]|uniref:Uncharacterized protein (TIGR04222 family) n=1 Tax=Saccharothrix australiensis TaxID=2072 RepID=A0A495VYJ7_9PSEU|nr:TIGR04222 domain-containing membrane protein [Saccharothrix australiensis]RKT53475.1 uncharacterized protein (TIGR04222 family) [Saccharothrix australiensis]